MKGRNNYMTKYDEEVKFLETAAGLELTILQMQDTLLQQQNNNFPGISTSQPTKPIMPKKPSSPAKCDPSNR